MGRFDIHRCFTCGTNEFEDNMLELNWHWFCGIVCYTKQKKIEDERLKRGK